MALFLDWYASHNTLVIQTLAASIAALIVIFIFRLFFVDHDMGVDAAAANKATYAHLEDKLNKLLEQQSQMKVSMDSVSDPTAGGSNAILSTDTMAALAGDSGATAKVGADGVASTASDGAPVVEAEQVAELTRLKGEISSLRESLRRKETEVIAAKEQAAAVVDTPQQAAQLENLNGQMTDYEKQIEELKNRLSDYEIIAEDIADLQKYRKENVDLRHQLSNMKPSSEGATPQSESPAAPEPADPDPLLVEQDISEPPPDRLPDVAAQSELTTAEALEVSKDVKKEDKVLLDDFEKYFAKGEDDL